MDFVSRRPFSGIVHHQVNGAHSIVGIDNEFVGANSENTVGVRLGNDLSKCHEKSMKKDEDVDRTESKPAGGPVNVG